MATTTAQGSGSTNNNGGSVLGLGQNQTGYDNVALGSTEHHYGSRNTLTAQAHFMTAFKGAAATATGIADNGSGFCRFTDSTHGLSVGQYLMFSGATAHSINTVHKITAVPTGNTFDTTVPYVASATPGDYQLAARQIAVLPNGKYIGYFLTEQIAGTSVSGLKTPAADKGLRKAVLWTESNRRYDVTSYAHLTHAPTYGANRGASYNYKNISGTPIDNSITLAELVYNLGTTPVYADYA